MTYICAIGIGFTFGVLAKHWAISVEMPAKVQNDTRLHLNNKIYKITRVL